MPVMRSNLDPEEGSCCLAGARRGIDKEVEPWYGYFVKICANINCKRESRDGRKDGFCILWGGFELAHFCGRSPGAFHLIHPSRCRQGELHMIVIIKAGTPRTKLTA